MIVQRLFLSLVSLILLMAVHAQKPAAVKKKVTTVTAVSQKPAPGAYFIYDTIKAGWREVSNLSIIYETSLMADVQGNIFAQVKTGANGSAYAILQNDQWKVLADEVKDDVFSLYKDINGNIFALSKWSKVYKKTGNHWKLVAGDSTYVFDISVQTGENFYGIRMQPLSDKRALVKWTGKSWTALETTSGILEFKGWPNVVTDKKGLIYFSTKDNDKGRIVQCLAGKERKELGKMPGDIWRLSIDEDGFVYATGGFNSKEFFLKKWDGLNWSDVPLPDGISKYVDPNIEFRGGKIHLWALTEDPNDHKEERFYFTLQKNKWKKICNYNTDYVSYLPIEAKGVLYVISRKSGTLLRQETGRIIKREVYTLSFAEGLISTTELDAIKNKFRMVKEGNKYGVINQQGEIVIFSVIDRLRIDKNPMDNVLAKYAFNLYVNGENFYVPISNYSTIDPFNLPGLSNEYRDKCKACNGKGRFEARTEYETVKGEWVEGYTSTTTRPSTMGGYQQTTITTPGYRKPSKERVKGTIPASDCNKCRGKGYLASGWKETIEYANNSYRKLRKEYADKQ